MLSRKIENVAKARTGRAVPGVVSMLVVAIFLLNLVVTPVSANYDYNWYPNDSRYDFMSWSNWDIRTGSVSYQMEPTADPVTGIVHMSHSATGWPWATTGTIIGTAGFVTPSNEHYIASTTGPMTLKASWRVHDSETFVGAGSQHVVQKVFCNIHDITNDTWYYTSNPPALTVCDETFYGSIHNVDGVWLWNAVLNDNFIQANHHYEIKTWISVTCDVNTAAGSVTIDMAGSDDYAQLEYVGLWV